jgi:cytochrome P450
VEQFALALPVRVADPDRLDLTRRARRHVAFGHGAHRCPGQALARVEVEIALSVLFRRVPGLRLATSFDDVTFDEDSLLHGVGELPVVWGPGPGSDVRPRRPGDEPKTYERRL